MSKQPREVEGRHRWGRRGRRGLIALVSVVAALLGAELLAATRLPSPPVDRAPLVRAAAHPVYGYGLVPDQRAYSYQAEVETNAQGLRERPRAVTVDPARPRRVLLVGGSETFGKGVPVERTFARRLEAALGPAWRTINAGTPDWTLDQSARFVAHAAAGYDPEVVVLPLYWDDLFTGAPPARTSSAAAPRPPARRAWGLRRWARDLGLLERIAPLYTRSRLLYAARNAAKQAYGRVSGAPSVLWQEALQTGGEAPGLAEAWARAQDSLSRIARWGQRHNVRVVVLVLPMEVDLEAGGEVWRAKALEAGLGAGLEVVDATPIVLEAPAAPAFIPYDGRPSAQGHARILRALLPIFEVYQQMP